MNSRARYKRPIGETINTIIGLAIMIFGRYIPSPTLIVEPSEKLINMGFPLVDGGILLSSMLIRKDYRKTFY